MKKVLKYINPFKFSGAPFYLGAFLSALIAGPLWLIITIAAILLLIWSCEMTPPPNVPYDL